MYEIYKSLRDKCGYTDYKVAKATGIPPSYLAMWKQGKTNPKVERLAVLSKFFEVPLSTFIKELG